MLMAMVPSSSTSLAAGPGHCLLECSWWRGHCVPPVEDLVLGNDETAERQEERKGIAQLRRPAGEESHRSGVATVSRRSPA
jgi:hypothetical protein